MVVPDYKKIKVMKHLKDKNSAEVLLAMVIAAILTILVIRCII